VIRLSLNHPVPGKAPNPAAQNRLKLAFFEAEYAQPLARQTGLNRLKTAMDMLHKAESPAEGGTPPDRFLANFSQMVTHRILPQKQQPLTRRYRYFQQLFAKAAAIKHGRSFDGLTTLQGKLTPQGKQVLNEVCACDDCEVTPDKIQSLLRPDLSQLINKRR
jgi:hypothetical protein